MRRRRRKSTKAVAEFFPLRANAIVATAKRFPLLTNSKRKAIAKRSALYANTINWQVPGNFENYYMQRYRFQQFLKKSV